MSDPWSESVKQETASAEPKPSPPDPASAVTLLAPNPSAPPADEAPTILTRRAQAEQARENVFSLQFRGRKLAHFELEEPLGVGGMAAVIRARDTMLDRRVALKILPPESARDPELVRRFHQEARAAAKLDHDNIARVYYCGEDQGLHFIAFEYVEGENLRALVERRGRLPAGEAVNYVLQIATGLAHASARGVVHRDIKPSNIIVGEGGRAKLVDMGLARSTGAQADDGLTHSGVTLGTFDYISPEQALEPRLADVRSDIYSLGCTFYHLLTGRSPVPEGTAARKLQFHQNELPTDPRQLAADLPDEVAAILSHMMAKDPGDRYQQPELLVQHLMQAAARLSGQPEPRPEQGYQLVDAILPAEPAVRPLVLGSCAAVVLTILVLALSPLLNETVSPARQTQRDPTPRAATFPATRPAVIRPDRPPDFDPQNPRMVTTVRNPQELRAAIAAAVADGKSAYVELDAGTYDLAQDDAGLIDQTPTILVPRGQIVLHGKSGVRPVLKLACHAGNLFDKERDWALFALTGGALTLSGLSLELHTAEAENTLVHVLAQSGQLTLRNCDLSIRGAAGLEASEPPAVVKVVAGGPTPPRIHGYNCVFAGGQRAFVLEDGAEILLRDCGLGAYQEPFHLVSTVEAHRTPTSITVNDSTWLVGAGPQFRLESRRACRVLLRQCVIGKTAASGPATLFSVGRDQPPSETHLEAEGNRYFDIESLIAREQERLFTDKSSRVERTPPWSAADPLKLLGQRDYVGAFRLRTDAAELRRPASTDLMLGAQRLLGTELYGKLDPVEATPSVPTVKEYVVDGIRGRNSYETLADAFNASESEGRDEIVLLLKLDGPIPTRSLEIGSRKITIRAAPGHHPELALHPDSVAGESGTTSLFRVQGGSLTLEGVRVRLGPLTAPGHRLVSLASLSGGGALKLRGCTATLEESDADVVLVSVSDPPPIAVATKPARPLPPPTIDLEDCFLRGKGGLVSIYGGKLQRLSLDNVLAVLDGTLLHAEGLKGDAMAANGLSMVSIKRSTVVVSQALLAVRTTRDRPLHLRFQLQCLACLFVSSGNSPLLRLEGPASEEEMRSGWIQWQGAKNLYATTGPLILWMPLELNAMPSQYDSERWTELWGRDDDSPRFARSVKFAGFPPTDRPLTGLEPADFLLSPAIPEMEPEEAGADLKRLPLYKAP